MKYIQRAVEREFNREENNRNGKTASLDNQKQGKEDERKEMEGSKR